MFVFLVYVSIVLSTAYCNVNISYVKKKKIETHYVFCNIASNVYF